MKTLELLLEITIYSGVLFAVILLMKLCFKGRMSPFLHFALWGLLIARLLLPVTLESSIHFIVLPEVAQPVAAVQQTQTANLQADGLPATAALNIPAATQQTQAAAPQGQTPAIYANTPASRPVALSIQDILLIVWLSGAGIGLMYLAIVHHTLRRRIRRNAALPSQRLSVLFEKVKLELGIQANLRLVCQYEYGTPALLFPRTVLIPLDMLVAMDDEQVKFALRHELTHFRRGDQVTSLLLSVMNAVYWFNPIVWLAFPMIRADMETACDSAVVRRMGSTQRSRYASLVVSLFARPAHRQLALGMALGTTKKMAERRVKGIFMRNRSGRGVRLASALIAAVLLVGCFTTACQPTPTKAIVVPKGDLDDKLLQTASPAPVQSNSSAPGDTTSTEPALRERMGIPETWALEKANEDNTVRLHIDASVEVPKVPKAMVYSAEIAPFTLEQAETLHQVLLGGAQLYEPSKPTREYWQEQIVITKKEIADAKERGDKAWQTKMEEVLVYYKEQYDKTPVNIERKPTELAFRQEAPSTPEIQIIQAEATLDSQVLSLFISKYPTGSKVDIARKQGKNFDFTIAGSFGLRSNLEAPEGVRLTKEQALEKATELMAQIDADMKPVSIGVGDCTDLSVCQVWMIKFTRVIGGMSSNDYAHAIDNMTVDNATPDYEMLEIGMDDRGLVFFSWKSPLSVTETINSDAALLDFADAQRIIADALYRNALGYFESAGGANYDLQVERVVLGLTRVAQQNRPGEYLLIPMWDVYGKKLPDQSKIPDKKRSGSQPTTQLLLTINAMDGSIIDTQKGY